MTEAKMARKRVRQAEAADHLGVRPQTLANWRYLGNRGPRYYRLSGGVVVYDLDDLDAFLEAHAHDPAAEPRPAR